MSRLKRLLMMILFLPDNLWLNFIATLPGESGFSLRYFYWKHKLKYLGRNVRIDINVFFQNPKYISIGDNTWIDKNVLIMAGIDKSEREKVILENPDYIGEPGCVNIGRDIHIGVGCIISGISGGAYISDECTLAAGCKVYSFSHHYRSVKNPSNKNIVFGSMVAHDRQCLMVGSVYLGKNVGVALNSVILPGVSILDGSFVTINSVVYKGRYPSNSIIEGLPAKAVGERFKGSK